MPNSNKQITSVSLVKKKKKAIPVGDPAHPCYKLLSVDLLPFETMFSLGSKEDFRVYTRLKL